ncbi:MAG: hypothetical protein ACRENP_08350 [Longimicrobiales bacterium]
MPDSTELVRIGEPQRPEYAAWRYGDQFGKRRQRQVLLAGGGLGVVGVGAYTSGLFGLSVPDRLALEMALHEEAELRALRGELAELERAWRDAEEIAAISDNMFTPSSIQKTLDKLRGE